MGCYATTDVSERPVRVKQSPMAHSRNAKALYLAIMPLLICQIIWLIVENGLENMQIEAVVS
jgi:hypothetical protein